MRIASEDSFGHVMSVLKWSNEDELNKVNAVEYGLTASIFTTNIKKMQDAV